MATKITPYRLILKESDRELLKQLQADSGISQGELITILLRKYGAIFLNWLNSHSLEDVGNSPLIDRPIQPAPAPIESPEFAAFEL